LREVAKVFGLSSDVQAALSGQAWGREAGGPDDRGASRCRIDPADRRIALVRRLVGEISRFPRHLSQHVGGFVITRGRLDHLCPISPAAMEGRTVIEWDKDDLDALGLLKVDVLALGMLSCIRRAFDMLRRHYNRPLTLASVPPEDAATYDMLCEGRSVGVFQVESRAQMAMLPRLQPRCFHDLVVQVAIVRPGPIQGDMVHPYLRRRAGLEKVSYPSEALRDVSGAHAGRAAVPGTGDADRHCRGRLSPAARRTSFAAPWPPSRNMAMSQVSRQDDPRHGRARL
jgi:error-prone DNA polymerase